MSWDGSGNFVRGDGSRTGATTWTQARDASVTVNAPDADTHDQDIADGLENCVTRDGQNSPSTNLPMNAKKHTGVADASANSEYAAYGQLLALVTPFVAAANVGGTAGAITLSPTPTITSYETGKGFRFFIETVNTGAVTLAVGSNAAVTMRRSDGTAFVAGDLPVGRLVIAIYNGSQWRTDVDPPSESGGEGTITAIVAGSGLTGGGTEGSVALAVSLTAALIPNLNASKINDGTFGIARIPDIPATKITGQLNVSNVGSVLSQAEYDALTPSANTLYFITG